MRLGQAFFLNVATIGVALAVYDALRAEAPAPRERAGRVPDTTDLERRIGALEVARGAAPQAAGDAQLRARLAELEKIVLGTPGTDPEPAAAAPAPDARDPRDASAPAWAAGADDEPGPAAIQRFRKLQEAVRREDAVLKNRARVDRALDKLPLRLTDAQRAGVHAAYAAFEPRVDEIWTEVKTEVQRTVEAGGKVDRGEIVAATTAVLQREFAGTIVEVVDHPADAEAIAAALMPGSK